MATWEDGPEYAPRERPVSYDVPRLDPLPDPEPYLDLSAGAPNEAPAGFEPAAAQPDLATLVIKDRHPRDPAQAYAVQTTTMTAPQPGAWSATHASILSAPGQAAAAPATFDPTRPFDVSAGGALVTHQQPPSIQPQQRWAPPADGAQPVFPAFGSPAWFGPGAPVRPAAPAAVSATDWFTAVTPIAFIAYVVGLVTFWFLPIAPVCFLIGFVGSFLVRYRQAVIRLTGALLLGLQVFVSFVALTLDSAEIGSMWATWNAVAGVSCGIHLAVVGVCAFLALRRRERPARR